MASNALERIGYKVHPAPLNAYYRCPRKFQMRYLRRVRMPFVFKSHLAIGSVTHKALASMFRHQRDGQSCSSLEAYASDHIVRERYPDQAPDELRAEHLPVVVGHMERSLAILPREAEVLSVEDEFTYRCTFSAVPAPVTIAAKVDLVIRHGDDGVVDHIDFKTGSQTGDLFQNVISRVAVAHTLDVGNERLRTINLLSATGDYQIVPSRREDHRHTWDVIRESIAALASDTTWRATSDPAICRWCDYRTVCDAAALDSDD